MFTENKTTELKREYVDDIKNTAIAFANCDGGTLYVGIEDDGTVRGVDDADGAMLRVTNAIRDAVRPDLTMFLAVSYTHLDDSAPAEEIPSLPSLGSESGGDGDG